MSDASWLPVVFIALMGIAVLTYSILDGYDLGVGMLLPRSSQRSADRDTMIASIGPFWDANETWLVLAVGLLLIAFPQAHSLVLGETYLATTFMLIGLILRGVAFDFRAKAAVDLKDRWDNTFRIGSYMVALSQGYVLGRYVMGFEANTSAYLFACISAVGVTMAYIYIGSCWLVLKTEGELQKRAVNWARLAGRFAFTGVVTVSVVNLWISPEIIDRWLEFPRAMFVLLIPLLCFGAFLANDFILGLLPDKNDRYCHLPMLFAIASFVFSFIGLGFSFYPYVVPGHITIWQAASAPESLKFILIGALIVVPCILFYTCYSYYVFRGKTTDLQYY